MTDKLTNKVANNYNNINIFSEKKTSTAAELLEEIMPAMNKLAPEPEEGWLNLICNETIAYMFPDNFISTADEEEKKAMRFFLDSYRSILQKEIDTHGFSPVDDICLLDEGEISECTNADEYRHLKAIWNEHYLFEFMRIYREITPFNTVGHIGGVHYVAVFVGRQLQSVDIPVDISLVSGAAACHDLGKFGCRPEEASRVPYLHYYYTDRFLTSEYMPMTAHIASNHSTWDLELENLSIESLLLIYADFRVKSVYENGEEKIRLYTLDESFQVILNKLDNVDDKKRQRYEKVYAKLKDFEGYLENLGVQTDISEKPAEITGQKRKDSSLLYGNEVVEALKYTAIEHNIKIMSIFNNESSFGSLIEAARSERQWKNQRAYVDILSEYHSYMTKQEKTLTLAFLYDLLAHREGDIRRQAGNLMGTVIATYDDVYRKEIPAAVNPEVFLRSDSLDVWDDYMKKIVFPDYKVTDRHRSWIGYAFNAVMTGLFENLDKNSIEPYLQKYVKLFKEESLSESAAFTMLNSVSNIEADMLSVEQKNIIMEFAFKAAEYESAALKVGALRAVEHLTEHYMDNGMHERIINFIDSIAPEEFKVSINFMKYEICHNINSQKLAAKYLEKAEKGDGNSGNDSVSTVLRENLKVGTPWVVKAANIDYLMQFANRHRDDSRMYHLATHFSNLIKVSEIVTVRRRAGISLIGIAENLHIDQINEIVIELSKGLEIGEYQFSKYIPEFLGQLALYLHPSELDEFITSLGMLIESNNDKVCSVALDTVGEILSRYSTYRHRTSCSDGNYEERRHKLLGMLLKGLANYHDAVSQEAFMVLGKFIFGNSSISPREKFSVFRSIYKKMLTLINAVEEYDMNFFNNAAALNHIYRFISEYEFNYGEMKLPTNNRIAFFPGTFDPFSLSHKGIVQAIKDEGFEVYLALDEFSWSKKTQPRQLRRIIITMSVADETDVFMFPDDFPVNIANPDDLMNLRELFPAKDVYMVVGSDVIINASSYNKDPVKGSIHSMNHIVFRRESQEQGELGGSERLEENYRNITGQVVELKLPMHLEDISSTRIRDNIDKGRDISNLIDPVAQNFIYDNSLYLREPQYKNILEKSGIRIEPLRKADSYVLTNLEPELIENGLDIHKIRDYINNDYVKVATVEDMEGNVTALVAVHTMETSDLYKEFGDMRISGYLRRKVTGRMLVIQGIYCNRRDDMDSLVQIISTEVIAQALKEDITYAIYHPVTGGINRNIRAIIERMGFTEIVIDNKPEPIFEVNMKEPIAVIQNLDTALKSPFNSNPRILDILQSSHRVLQEAITKLNPGNLVLSFNEGVLNEKIVDMVTQTNGVPNYPLKPRVLGEYMCVPFGKTLRNSVVPNTVTKTLHTEKIYSPTLDSFTIEEYPRYATLSNQIKTIKSFRRPVILVDDLLHNGYRLQKLDPFFKENNIQISKIITGLLSGNGKDLMDVQGRDVESAYFIPNLKAWFIESGLCPFIGGDGIRTEDKTAANLIPSINQLLPFAAMSYLDDCPREAIYELSYVCIDNAIKIFKVLEDEYQEEFERKLTVKRLSDAVIGPRMPNGSNRLAVNFNLAPSVYMAEYMQRLLSLESAFK